MRQHLVSSLSLLGAAALAILSGCATAGPGAASATTTAAATSTTAAAPAAQPAGQAPAPGTGASAPRPTAAAVPTPPRAPGSPTPFAEVVKDAKSTPGLLTIWTKDEKTWLEIPEQWLDKPMFFGNSLASGLGEKFFLPGLMGREYIVVFHRLGNGMQLIARNTHARAPEGTPLARAVAESYSDSLLASVPLAAAAHPERKSLLVDATALLGGDLLGVQTNLEAAFRLPYTLDRGNTAIERTHNSAQATAITLKAHYAIPKMPPPPAFNPAGPPPNPAMLPSPPTTTPDARSLFLSLAYTFSPLPAQPMKARLADQRVGYFTSAQVDFGNDASDGRRVHMIDRWRLEKKDPAAEMSEPKEPIRVVMDRNIPDKWRAPVRAGILEWNSAFERAGFRNAIAVEQQPADADWTLTEGVRMLAVRWFAMEGPGAVAVGPSQSDPRSGEILRSAAIIPENWVRVTRAMGADIEPRVSLAAAGAAPEFAARYMQCSYALDALEQTAFGLELLGARGAFDPNGPEGERLITDALKEVVMHEVGHALGLRHNFKGTTSVTQAQLRDPAYTRSNGISNSVMDYVALNLPLQGEATSDLGMSTLGSYDHWAIEYGYREFAEGAEKAGLTAIAARSEREPALVFATDEDAYGADPSANLFDLSDDPLAHARRQFTLARELWTLTQARQLAADDDLTVYRRNLQRGLGRIGQAVPLVAKYIGGANTSRQLAGSGQALVEPVAAPRQREALELLVGELFASNSFKFDPKFMGRLGINQLERMGPSRFITSTDFSLPNAVLGMQRPVLDYLMSDTVASRLADAESKVADPRSLLSYAEVQTRLSDAVWTEVKAGRDIDSLRRNLQREHLKRLAGSMLRPSSAAATDVRSVHRLVATRLEADLKRALTGRNWSDLSRAHLVEAAQTLTEALHAPLMKQGV